MMADTAALHVAVGGASGMIGAELLRQLRADGHRVTRLVRRAPRGQDEVRWSAGAESKDAESKDAESLAGLMETADAVVNFSGAPLDRLPWTHGYKREIRDSRVRATRALVAAMARAAHPPAVFLSASAVGVYGDRPGERLDESSAVADSFLARVVTAWEQAARGKPAATRLVLFRTGLVIGGGGAMAPLTALTRLGLGARIGTGGDIWPWISLYDEAAAIRHLITSDLSGPVNLVGPTPATSDRITRSLARKMHRPRVVWVPEWALVLALQDAAKQLLLCSQRISPDKLLGDGFHFRDTTVEQAIDAMLAGRESRADGAA
jgi:uncharacterized protein